MRVLNCQATEAARAIPTSEGPATLTDRARGWAAPLLQPFARFIGRLGISANLVTLIGLLLTSGVAMLLAMGWFRPAGLLLVVASLCDALDGTLARQAERANRFGAFLDSTLDRYSEVLIFLGLLLFYIGQGNREALLLVYVATVGSLLVSYTRARAEALGIVCKGGVLTRFERAIVLLAGLLLGQMRIALWILAILANFTAGQRIYLVWRATDGKRRI